MIKLKGTPLEVYNQLGEHLENLEQDKQINILVYEKETKETRTIYQNSMFHGLFNEISKHLGYSLEETKRNILKGVFGTRQVTVGLFTSEEAIKPHTSELNKEEGIFFIDCIKKFITKYKVPCKYESREFQSLYDSYK